jgi:hypothetical protein
LDGLRSVLLLAPDKKVMEKVQKNERNSPKQGARVLTICEFYGIIRHKIDNIWDNFVVQFAI